MANTTSARSWWWREFEPIVRLQSATIIVGAASGAVIGGLGGRLAVGPACHERAITPRGSGDRELEAELAVHRRATELLKEDAGPKGGSRPSR